MGEGICTIGLTNADFRAETRPRTVGLRPVNVFALAAGLTRLDGRTKRIAVDAQAYYAPLTARNRSRRALANERPTTFEPDPE